MVMTTARPVVGRAHGATRNPTTTAILPPDATTGQVERFRTGTPPSASTVLTVFVPCPIEIRPPLQHLSTAVKAAPNGTLCTSGAPRPRLVQEGRGAATDTPCRAFCPADSPHGKHVAVGHHGAIHSRKPSLPSASMGINRTHLYTRAGRVERTEKKDQEIQCGLTGKEGRGRSLTR